jgi:transcriptional accessory protein Tex/SPT6
VPFIARYRKEATGNLDEVKIQDIEECRLYYTALEQRRQVILSSVESQGKLTDELREKIRTCFSKGELEDLYLPFKPKRRTKAGEALRLGLGPLAEYIWEQTGNEPVGVYAERFVSPPEPKIELPPAATPEAPSAPLSETESEPVTKILQSRTNRLRQRSSQQKRLPNRRSRRLRPRLLQSPRSRGVSTALKRRSMARCTFLLNAFRRTPVSGSNFETNSCSRV